VIEAVGAVTQRQQEVNPQPQPFNPNSESYGRRVDARDGSIWPRIDTGFRFTPAPHPPIQPHPSRYSLPGIRAITRSAPSQVQPLDAVTNRERIARLQQAEWAIEHDHDEHRVFDSRMLAKPAPQRRIAGVFNKLTTEHPDYGYSKPLCGATTHSEAIVRGYGNFDSPPIEHIASAGENSVHLLPATEEASYREETLGREGTRPYRILVASTRLRVSVKPLSPCEGYGVRFAARDATGNKGKTRATMGALDYTPHYTRSAPTPLTPAPRQGWFPFRWFPVVAAPSNEQFEESRGGVLPLFDKESATRWIGDLTGNAVTVYPEKRKAKIRNSKPPYVVWPPRRKSPFNRDRFGSPLELRLPRYAWNLHSPLRTVADHEREAELITFSDREEEMSQAAVKDDDPLTMDDVMMDVEFDWHPIIDQKKKRAQDFLARQGDGRRTPLQREQDRVARLVLQDFTQEQIARRMGISRHKVRDHIAEMTAK
jgi:DNA-binding CsgD family transcriptional regulator